MRTTTWWIGLGVCFSLACSAADEASEATPAGEEPKAAAPTDPGAPNEPAPAPGEVPNGEEPAPIADSDAGAPAADGGADAGADAAAPKPKIPAPTQGTLIVTTNTGAMCEWTVGGVAKGTSAQLTTQLYGGTYDIACKRVSDAKVISEKAYVTGSQTTNLQLTFKGKVEAVSNTSCTWLFAGFIVGSPGLTYTAEHLPGTSSLQCMPSDPGKTPQTKVIQIVADTTTPVVFAY